MRFVTIALSAAAVGLAAHAVLAQTTAPAPAPAQAQPAPNPAAMTFFVTSTSIGKGGDLGGLAGADAHCQALATAAGSTGRTWRAYLSTQATGGAPAVNAKDRIGAGPWVNAKGIQVAKNVADLHGYENMINKTTALDEKGNETKGRGDTPNQHDILTGTQHDGTAFPAGEDRTCNNWTSSTTGSAWVGHTDLQGNGRGINFWNYSHATPGCDIPSLNRVGGNGYLYCFAAN